MDRPISPRRPSGPGRPAPSLLLLSLVFFLAWSVAASVPRSASAQEVEAAPDPVLLVGATVVDGTGGPPLRDAVVLLMDGRIACVGSGDTCPLPTGVRILDLEGKWIIPGLVDAHVHYSQTGWADGRPDALDVRDRFPYARTVRDLEQRPDRFYRAWLCSGVTATFDVGGYPWTWNLRRPAEGSTRAPHVAAAGPLLSTRDHWVNVPAERQFVHIPDDSAVVQGVRYLAANDTDAVKVWFLAGEGSDDAEGWARRVRLAGEHALRSGRPLIVHATGLWQAKHAVRSGARLLVHSVYDGPVDDEFLRMAGTQGTIYTPTLVVSDGYVQLRARSFDAAAYELQCVDPRTRRKAFLTDSLPGRPDDATVERMERAAEERRELMYENLRRVRDAGIPIAMGTDAGNPLTLHGPSVFLEMEAMQEAGMTPMEVLVASTRTAADAMGRVADLGTVEVGKAADLVVLGADPTVDIANVRRIEWVVRRGKVWSRDELEWPR